MQGKVKFFDAAKGYGFLVPSDGSRDVFIHITDLQSAGILALLAGATLKFDITDGKNGPKAINVSTG